MIPSVGTPIGLRDILNGLLLRRPCEGFEETIAKQTGRKYVVLTNSGTTAYFLILKALQRLSTRREVILPAYTAPSLILPIQKAGLIPRLCDIDLATFNMDLAALREVIGDNTLAVTIVHMFGLPTSLEHPSEDAFLIEDLASAHGSILNGRTVGSFGDVSFVSFNRGKNFSTFSGGAIGTDREDIHRFVIDEGKRCLREPSFKVRTGIILKSIALAFAVRPWFYTIFRRVISPFKYKGLHYDFDIYAYTRFQAGMGNSAFKKAWLIFERRRRNGFYLHSALSGIGGIVIPSIPAGFMPAFNQFPLLIEDQNKRDVILKALIRGGIEATILYPEPIHEIYDLGYESDPDPFPKATYLSRRLILIPTHPYVTERHLKKAADIIKKYL